MSNYTRYFDFQRLESGGGGGGDKKKAVVAWKTNSQTSCVD